MNQQLIKCLTIENLSTENVCDWLRGKFNLKKRQKKILLLLNFAKTQRNQSLYRRVFKSFS